MCEESTGSHGLRGAILSKGLSQLKKGSEYGQKKYNYTLQTNPGDNEEDYRQLQPLDIKHTIKEKQLGAQWLSGRVLDSRPRDCRFKPHRRH